MNKTTANHQHSNAPRADGSEAGFTLVEAMIAMLVTVVGLVSIAGMFTMAMKTNASSRNMTTATTFAQDKLEQLGALTFERLVDPAKMQSNPNSHGADDAYAVGSLDQDVTNAGVAYFDKIILAGRDKGFIQAHTADEWIDIDELRKERHFFANEAMRAMALEIKIADLTVERDRLRAALPAEA